MKIYVASSWRNVLQPGIWSGAEAWALVVEELRRRETVRGAS